MDKSIFEHPFYGSLLAKGEIHSDIEIPTDLLNAMAILIGRSCETYIDPMECKDLASLVVLGIKRGVLD